MALVMGVEKLKPIFIISDRFQFFYIMFCSS